MRTAVALALCLSTAAVAQTQPTSQPTTLPATRAAAECVPRGGLPNVVAKARAGGVVRVAYLGGSITAAPGWRVLSREWLGRQYPGVRFDEINAAISGTGAEFGAARLRRDVLDHKPDLIFVEFAVNGAGGTRDRVYESTEGVVRQARAADPDVDLCFVYTIQLSALPTNQAGRVTTVVDRMEAVADHYGLPSINFGVDVAARVTAGTLAFTDDAGTDGRDGKPATTRAADGRAIFTADGAHPLLTTGHALYRDAIARSWPAIVAASARRSMPAPLAPANWSRARFVAVDALDRVGDWSTLDAADPVVTQSANLGDDRPVWRGDAPEAGLTFTFSGTSFGLHAVKGSDAAAARVSVDDRPPVVARIFDDNCVEARWRTKPWFYPDPLPPGEHRVRVEAIAEPDKAKRVAATGKPIQNVAVFDVNRLYLRGVYLINEP